MTYEELKIEAAKLGYSLVKFTKREKLLPCVCGRNKRSHWYGYKDGKEYYTLMCSCGMSATGYTELEVRHNWNEMIKELNNADK